MNFAQGAPDSKGSPASPNKQVIVVGCGIIGAMIAYELSQLPHVQVLVLDRQPPAQASTGAALGVMMGIISQKTKGRAWNLRQTSMQRYATLLPELEAITGQPLPWNRQGLLKLCFADDDLSRWQQLVELRQQQGWQLALWSLEQVQARCPQVKTPHAAALYSPQDYQVDPTALTRALVAAAQQQGAVFRFDVEVQSLVDVPSDNQFCRGLVTSAETLAADWIVIAAGLGSTPLTQSAQQPVLTGPVLGQAMQVRLDQPLGDPTFQPVITGNDIHIVPLGHCEYWIGATVEFPPEAAPLEAIQPEPARLDQVWQGAVEICPELANATLLKTWSGLRPRPQNRPAPIVEPLAGYSNVFIATGHYRNGVLLAPATAQIVRAAVEASL